jgi:hypothetical protein
VSKRCVNIPCNLVWHGKEKEKERDAAEGEFVLCRDLEDVYKWRLRYPAGETPAAPAHV